MAKNIFFLCSPSLGILDNWLPIIYSLKKSKPLYNYVFVISKPGNIEHIDLENVLIKIANNTFNQIISKSNSEKWFRTDNFNELKVITKRSSIEDLFVKLQKKLNHHISYNPFDFFLKGIIAKIENPKLKKYYIDFEHFIDSSSSVLLYDIYDQQKTYNQGLVKLFKKTPAFSINHGIDINQDQIIKKYSSKDFIKEIKAYLYSKHEIEYYKNSFGLDESDLHICGIPRHSLDWIDFIIKESSNNIKWSTYVFLISRSLSPYFTFERKKQALINIKKIVIDELGLKIIVKQHPKEPSDGLFYKIFGKENHGKTWQISNEHPFTIGKRAFFALSFYSGVSIDMLALNKPIIEYLDLIGLPGYDNKDSLRDSKGEPVLSLRYLGLVLGCSDENSLRNQVLEIKNNQDISLQKILKKFNELFERKVDAITLVKNDIIQRLEP